MIRGLIVHARLVVRPQCFWDRDVTSFIVYQQMHCLCWIAGQAIL